MTGGVNLDIPYWHTACSDDERDSNKIDIKYSFIEVQSPYSVRSTWTTKEETCVFGRYKWYVNLVPENAPYN